MRVAETVGALCVALLGATTIALARQLPYDAEYGPGSGFLPFWLGVALVVLSVFLFREARMSSTSDEASSAAAGDGPVGFARFAPGALAPWLIFFVSTVAVSLLFEHLGFGLSIGAFMLVTMRWVAGQSWPATIALAVVTPVALFLLFVRVLLVPLPLAPPGF